MPVQTEGKRLHDVLAWEEDNNFSRDKVTILSGESVVVGEVLGKIEIAVPTTGTADAGNTGDGTITAVTGGEDTKPGVYTLTCKTAAANGGVFAIVDPEGESLPDVTVGTAFTNDQINLTINDGSTDFVVGDTFTIDCSGGSGKYVALDFASVVGGQKASAISTAAYDATSADVEGVVIKRNAIVKLSGLVWPDGITAAQKQAALDQLEKLGIITNREEA